MSRPCSISKLSVPTVSAEQMREVDRLMEEQYGVALLQMMENAGRNLAHLARRRYFDGDARNRQILVLAGSGGNGGGGLVCARRLHNWGTYWVGASYAPVWTSRCTLSRLKPALGITSCIRASEASRLRTSSS